MEPIGPLLAGAAAGVVSWFAILGVIALGKRPNRPEPGPETTDLGDEPPAVVNLLASGFRVTTEAVPATLLDLAARGHVLIELVPGGRDLIRLRPRRDEQLTPYEEQVLSHVEAVAEGGIVPAAAITTGPQDASRRWWHAFRERVIADAQARGLSRNRWDAATVGALWLAGLAVAFVYAAASRFDSDVAFGAPESVVVFAGLVGMGALLVAITGSRSQADVPEGLAAAGRWLGTRAVLAHNEALRRVPPSAVATYGRHLAHAAAMGLAGATTSGLPLGAEDDHDAWSPEGGRWHRVRVRYPRFRPAWGLEPRVAALLAAVWALPAALLFVWVWPFTWPVPEPGFPEEVTRWIGRVKAGLGAASAAALGGAAWVLVQTVADLGARRTVRGTVVRLRSRPVVKVNPYRKRDKRRWYVALDDGSSEQLLAWSVRPSLYQRLTQGERAEATITPRLRHVEDLKG